MTTGRAPRMDLYLVQHGLAKHKEEDPERPLTGEGRSEVVRVVRAVARAGVRPNAIYHSGKLRARQTADILADALKPARGVAEMQGLAPSDDPNAARRAIDGMDGPVMLVGHLPHLGRLASLLLGIRSGDVVAFRQGAVLYLVSGDDRQWQVGWMLTPGLAG